MGAFVGEDVLRETDVSEREGVWTVLVDGCTARVAKAVLFRVRWVGFAGHDWLAPTLMSSGASIARTPSRESLTVHPLLTNPAVDSARYVPYTPRQRSAPSQGGKPPLVNLKAAAQGIGLEPTSIGWAILDKIAYEGDTSDEWSEIWSALTKARVRRVSSTIAPPHRS